MTTELKLPDIISLNDHSGDWEKYLDLIYSIFERDFINSSPKYKNKINTKYYPEVDHQKYKNNTFWHLISEGEVEAERVPALDRCERIAWIRPIIELCTDCGLLIWSEDRQGRKGQETRVHIALPDCSYLVVLAERKNYTLLWTAYPIKHEHSRKKLQQRFENAQKKLGSP